MGCVRCTKSELAMFARFPGIQDATSYKSSQTRDASVPLRR